MKNRSKESVILGLVLLAYIVYTHFIQKPSLHQSHIHEDETLLEEWWKLSPIWVEDQRPHINPHRYGILINNPAVCSRDEKVTLLILVASAVSHADRRNAIRQTWASNLSAFNTKLVFLLGQGRDQQSKIHTESQMFGDIIQEDFEDTYHNLTLKTVMGLKWTSIFCSQAQFVLKTDDDIFVNLQYLHKSIKENMIEMESKIRGCIKNSPLNSPLPISAAGQNIDVSLMKPALPEFVAGAGYLVPGKFVADLYVASLSTKPIPVEDAYTTGFCARKIGAHPPLNDARFSCGQIVAEDCEMQAKFTGHKINPERMWSIQDKLEKGFCGH